MDKSAANARLALETRLRILRELGIDVLFRSDFKPARGAREEPGPRPDEQAELPLPDMDIAAVHREVLTCRKCALAAARTQAVPGEGNFRAELMFVGEGPGHDEDIQGRPFVGRAGQLLTKIIEAMTYRRPEVFITNVVKCRPPDNRVPHRDEVEACAAYLNEQIRNIRPKVIVTLGKVATDFFLPEASGGMTGIRGRFYTWNGIPVMPTFHPSYLIRNEGNKDIRRMVWEDMQMVMARLGKT